MNGPDQIGDFAERTQGTEELDLKVLSIFPIKDPTEILVDDYFLV